MMPIDQTPTPYSVGANTSLSATNKHRKRSSIQASTFRTTTSYFPQMMSIIPTRRIRSSVARSIVAGLRSVSGTYLGALNLFYQTNDSNIIQRYDGDGILENTTLPVQLDQSFIMKDLVTPRQRLDYHVRCYQRRVAADNIQRDGSEN